MGQRVGRGAALAGLTCTLLSGVPLHWGLYAAFSLVVIVSLVVSARRYRWWARAAALVTAGLLAGVELPWRR
ncbi:MAG TPA: hypothetical protein VF310_01270, partial [Vicinamibacteria bacterium]